MLTVSFNSANVSGLILQGLGPVDELAKSASQVCFESKGKDLEETFVVVVDEKKSCHGCNGRSGEGYDERGRNACLGEKALVDFQESL